MSKKLLNEIKRTKELMSITEEGGLVGNALNFLMGTGSIDFLNSVGKSQPQSEKKTNVKGKIKHNFSGKAGEMVNRTIEEMEKMGITNPYTQMGILSVIGKESGFTAVKEQGYCNTSDSRIISVFGDRGKKCYTKKCNDVEFFDCVYGKDSGTKLGNVKPGDGWRYVGRGLNGITGRANYRKYGDLIGVNLENNPELLEKPDVSAKAAIAFFLRGKDPKNLPNFTDKDTAIKYFADLNAGKKSEFSRVAALKISPRFDIA